MLSWRKIEENLSLQSKARPTRRLSTTTQKRLDGTCCRAGRWNLWKGRTITRYEIFIREEWHSKSGAHAQPFPIRIHTYTHTHTLTHTHSLSYMLTHMHIRTNTRTDECAAATGARQWITQQSRCTQYVSIFLHMHGYSYTWLYKMYSNTWIFMYMDMAACCQVTSECHYSDIPLDIWHWNTHIHMHVCQYKLIHAFSCIWRCIRI